MVPQSPRSTTDPRWDVADVIAEAVRARGRGGRASARAEAAGYLDLVGLGRELLDARPAALSGGEIQRVVIARALACRPRLIVHDEPVSSLDVLAQRTVLDVIEDLRSRGAVAQVLITHDRDVANEVADRTVVLEEGRIVSGEPVVRHRVRRVPVPSG